ncbi:MAG: peptide chain release factor N(5)-glutamine methyltransferase [Candidatus Komeilibacteria bacterium]|nr:peptide chain release factor N(5)-glutamine methyltransferase [Candidatus Komeilibacteria bacterium]
MDSRSLLNKAAVALRQSLKQSHEIASLEAVVLLSHAWKKNKAYIYSHPEISVPTVVEQQFNNLLKRRVRNIPLAYITGQKEFYGLEFKVNEATLIPRPASELFLDKLATIQPRKKTIADIGTGSGALIITSAKLWPDNDFIATDISPRALQTARQNARLHHCGGIGFIKHDLLPPAVNPDIVMANLPYLPPDKMNDPSVQAEPSLALYGGADGLKLYRRLLRQIFSRLHTPSMIMMEAEPDDIPRLRKIAQLYDTENNYRWQIDEDIYGHSRLLTGRRFDR